jgi:hypothetical protein
MNNILNIFQNNTNDKTLISGIQRIQQMSISQLLNNNNIIIPKIQRECDIERVEEIKKYQKEFYSKNKCFNFIGCIYICELNNNWYLIDGQHRYSVMKDLYDTGNNFDIFVNIISVTSMEEVYTFFKIINKSLPLPNWIKEGTDAGIDIKEYIKGKYPKIIKASQKPRKPHINVDIFVEKLLIQLKGRNIPDLINYIENENTTHLDKLNLLVDKYPDLNNVITKATEKNKFYLGIYWCESIPDKISKSLQAKVWKRWMGNVNEGNCFCCKNIKIDSFNFACGHVIPKHYNGETIPDNLRPICTTCNSSMGIKNMNEYMKNNGFI